ncbi:MAG TPA: hypothetical protein VFH91_05600 [Pyrinomonadaceae bacterium]|nr:hypothetical protein [Pyrinomonadaceae bacterium]
MRRLPDIQRKGQRKALFAASSLVLLLATQSLAQSGRRTSKPSQTPTPTPELQQDPAALPDKESGRGLTQKVSLLVAGQFSSKHLLSEDAILSNMISHLSEWKNIKATSLGTLKHSEATKRAKLESEQFVVLVQFDVDEFQSGTIILNSPDLDVRILVFAPQTGQKKFEGKVYYKAVGGPMLKKDNWPNGTPIRITTEAVGIEAAEQIRDWLIVAESRRAAGKN